MRKKEHIDKYLSTLPQDAMSLENEYFKQVSYLV